MTGYVSRRNVQVGSQVSSQSSLMAIVPVQPVWVDANFKETQLENVRIGQPVTINSDFYGSNVSYKGTVVGLDMGTGSAFSLLPAQMRQETGLKWCNVCPCVSNLTLSKWRSIHYVLVYQ